MKQTRRAFAGAETTVSFDQGMAYFEAHGCLTDRLMPGLLSAVEQDLTETLAAALVARYDAALVQLDADALLVSASGVIKPGAALLLPTALVVTAETMPMWRTYCQLQARRGVLRMPFLSVEDAARWAADQAALFAAQARFHERARSR